MHSDAPARPTPRRSSRFLVAVLLVVIVAIIGALGYQSMEATSSTAAPSLEGPPRGNGGALGEADGAVPDGTTIFDDNVPGVAKLDPALLGALRRAATKAERDGVQFEVDSGWRSPEYQQHLLDDAIAKYGSREEAARWVDTPARSAHVSGGAVDIGSEAATWLSEHGAEYGLCQIYGNEPWHFELRSEAVADGCPALYADATRARTVHR
jgi:hypothetical protein